MSGFHIGIAVPLLCALLFPLAGCGKKEEPAAASAAKSTGQARTRETSVANVVAELVESKRKDGVLTVQIRFRNTGPKPVTFYPVTRGNHDSHYVTAEDKKYFVLRDEDRTALAPQVNPGGDVFVSLQPDGTYIWWAKYPAPPVEVKKMSYYTSITPPFDDVPISDQ
jgi:hypothetical protein